MKPRNQNAAKPDHDKVWNKGRITVDLGSIYNLTESMA